MLRTDVETAKKEPMKNATMETLQAVLIVKSRMAINVLEFMEKSRFVQANVEME